MIVIVRHGNTFDRSEEPRRIGWRTDLPLTDAGTAQARALGVLFNAMGWRFSRALVAPLRRTRETASAILAQLAESPGTEICDWLKEIDHGPDENQPEPAVLARIGPDALDAWDRRGTPPRGWVVDGNARRKSWRGLFTTAMRKPGKPTLVVTSNGAARFALLAHPDLEETAARLPSLKLPTGGYGIINCDSNGKLTIAAWGERP